MSRQHGAPGSLATGRLLPAYRWLAALFAVLMVVQAFLGTRGFFSANSTLVDSHAGIGNIMGLMAIAMLVLAWLLHSRNVFSMRLVMLSGVLVVATFVQIGLGFSTREPGDFVTAISMHIPLGVTLMAISSLMASMAWQIFRGPSPEAVQPRTDGRANRSVNAAD